ncbi:hypothetical protein DFS34DRAFT_593122 [Phlyctochytrium arcticum]|nr:hypothetical protein DFS34DRAFT_593122 [Phlyctochytrium arcticum]
MSHVAHHHDHQRSGDSTAVVPQHDGALGGASPAVRTWQNGQPVETVFNPENVPHHYQAQEQLERLRGFSNGFGGAHQAGGYLPPNSGFSAAGNNNNSNLTTSGGSYNTISGNQQQNNYNNAGSLLSQYRGGNTNNNNFGNGGNYTNIGANYPTDSARQQQSSTQSYQGPNSAGKQTHNPRDGATYTEVKGDPQTHTVTLSTTVYRPAGSNFIEAVDTYTYRRPQTTNGEYGNFPRRTHFEHEVDEDGDDIYAQGGKVVKNGDEVVPLGGPGSAEERPGLARHGGVL